MGQSKNRREFLRMAAAATGTALLPQSIRKALALPANRTKGSIQDVGHVVILMQENRSFDHYFGSLRGVRGFNDPRPVKLPNGNPIWYQPPAKIKTKRYHNRGLSAHAKHILPWYLNPKNTTEYQAGTDHGWSSGHLAWNHGKYDQWVNQKQDVLTMGYLKREDVSFHYALADAFTLCDSYFCSAFADTLVNRIYLWTGTCDPRNTHGTKPNGPALEERGKVNGYTWTTYSERLEANNVSWKVYQGGSGVPGTPTDNYTDNSLEFFAQYQVAEGASATSALVQKGASTHTLVDFHDDVQNNRLPQVSWIVAPYKYCEHPEASPTDGAYYINLVLEALTSKPEIWGKTAFLINYDENDGLFDHVVPPMPPNTQAMNAQGRVSDDLADSLKDEFVDMDRYGKEEHPLIPGADARGLQPVGLGPRVPMLIVSPWTKGGWVCSQTFDHTSVLQFLEARFGVQEPNISKWRRAVCGDLTSAFDFSSVSDAKVSLFVVPEPIVSRHQPYRVPMIQKMPLQEPGVRPARPLPYEFSTRCRIEEEKVWIDFENVDRAGVAFYVYNGRAPHQSPRRYALSASKTLSDYWEPLKNEAGYDLSIYGPNGSLFHFKGRFPSVRKAATSKPEATVHYDRQSGDVYLTLVNEGAASCALIVRNSYGNSETRHYELAAGARTEDSWLLASSSGWFDISIEDKEDSAFFRRFAGHVETGRPSTSDPGVYSVSDLSG
ncbi:MULTISPECIES: phosphocholine-specific phospholipase C [Acidobacteriaceae]|uniref:phosphocholine-specific phospholipase C n=1 Tax=Acidobacteriaceae TaxID=204434 RepID=UPI00131D63D7|nr:MULTISPECIES: phospholipase C, phosphocholine-specific [Acidobacteriaceae]MDW5265962.1 phospholipase C, phosphocholine-specific [Edaphobacter sp.]